MAPPISPYTRPGWSPPICRVALELRSVFPIFLCAIPHFSMAIILSVSLTPACPCLVFPLGAVPWTLDLDLGLVSKISKFADDTKMALMLTVMQQ